MRAIGFQQSQVTQSGSLFSFKTDRIQGLSEPVRDLFSRNQPTKHTIPSSSQWQSCSSALTSRGTNTESDEPWLEGEVAGDLNAQSKGWRTVVDVPQKERARANPGLVTGCAPSNLSPDSSPVVLFPGWPSLTDQVASASSRGFQTQPLPCSL